MRNLRHRVAMFGLGFGCCVACQAPSAQDGQVPKDYRLVSGRVTIGDDGILGRQLTGLQMAAISVVDGAHAVAVSDIFDAEKGGASNNAAASFSLVVPVDRAFSLVLQVPRSSGRGPGEWIAVYSFPTGEDTTTLTALVPAGDRPVQLGTLEARDGDPSTVADNSLGGALAKNPLEQVDSDGDGVVDLVDDDDDEDGTLDELDEDVAGDGILDVEQTLSALPDEDGNGVPDVLEK